MDMSKATTLETSLQVGALSANTQVLVVGTLPLLWDKQTLRGLWYDHVQFSKKMPHFIPK